MRETARAELESLAERGIVIDHRPFEVLHLGLSIMIACTSLGDHEATANANVPKEPDGSWKIADSQPCNDHSARRHLTFELVGKNRGN